jgi:multiple sugar transport system substrate-binding protein
MIWSRSARGVYPAVLCLALCALLLVPAFSQAQAPVTVSYWLWLDDPTDPMFPALIKEFNDSHPGIRVVPQVIPLDQFHDKLVTAISAGSGPDASRFKDWWLGEFVQAGALEPLSPYIAHWSGRNDVIANLWSTGRISPTGLIYMMPHQFITFYLYYRKDWFQQNGLQPPRTFDEFVTAAKRLTDPAHNRYGFGLRGGAGGQDQWLAFMVAGGARVVDRLGRVVVNSPKAVEVNQWYIDLYRTLKVTPPSAPSDAYAQVLGAFEAGITAMFAHHVGSSVLVTQKLGNDAVGVVNIPVADPKAPATMDSMSGNVLIRGSKNTQAAWTFVSWLTERNAMDKWSRSRQGQLPVLASLANSADYQGNVFFKTSLDAAKFSISWPGLPGVGYVSAQLWQQTMQQALLGQISSRQMLDRIATALLSK